MKILCNKKFWSNIAFLSERNFWSEKNVWVQKLFWADKNVGSKKKCWSKNEDQNIVVEIFFARLSNKVDILCIEDPPRIRVWSELYIPIFHTSGTRIQRCRSKDNI